MKKEQPLFDRHGKEIREFDLIKVFHFTGDNGRGGMKNFYMYKWVLLRELNGMLHWFGSHLDGNSEREGYWLGFSVSENRVIVDAEIVQSAHEDRYISK